MFQHGYPETVPTKVPRGRTHKSTQGGYPQKFSEGVPTKVPRKVPRIYPGHGAHKPTQRGAHKVPTRGFKSGTQEKLKNVPRIDPGHGAHESTQELTQRCTQKRYPQKHPQKEPTKRPHVVSGRRLSRPPTDAIGKAQRKCPGNSPENSQKSPRNRPGGVHTQGAGRRSGGLPRENSPRRSPRRFFRQVYIGARVFPFRALPERETVPCRTFRRAPSARPPARPCPTGLPLLLPLLPVIGRRPPLPALNDAQFLAPLSPALPSSLIRCPGGF